MRAILNRRDELLLDLFVSQRRDSTGEPSKQVVLLAGNRCRVGPPMRRGMEATL